MSRVHTQSFHFESQSTNENQVVVRMVWITICTKVIQWTIFACDPMLSKYI
jgi:hypothetical protein